MTGNDIELNVGINAKHLEESIQKVLGRVSGTQKLKVKDTAKGPFAAFAREKTKVGKVHLDPLKKPKDERKELTTDTLKRLMKLWKIDLVWKWIKGTFNAILKTNPILDSLMSMLNAALSLISMALLMPFLDDILGILKTLLKESAGFFKWMLGFKGLDISEVPDRIVEGINTFFDKINWGEVGTKIGTTISGVIETIKKVIEEVDWDKIGKSLGTIFSTTVTNIDWVNIGKLLGEAAAASIKIAFGIGKGLWEGGLEAGDKMLQRFADKLGKEKEDVTIWDKLFPGYDRPPSLFLADGGIVTKPTEAIVGEAGPEAVIPLDQMRNMGGTSITVSGLVDEYKFRSIIKEEIEKSNRRLYNARGAVSI